MTDLERLVFFYQQTKKRKLELEYKKKNGTMNRAEMFELDMCNGDIKRCEKELNSLKSKTN